MLEKIERNFGLFAPAILLLALAPALFIQHFYLQYALIFRGYNLVIAFVSFLGTIAGLRLLARGMKEKTLRSPLSLFLSVILVSIPWMGTLWVIFFAGPLGN